MITKAHLRLPGLCLAAATGLVGVAGIYMTGNAALIERALSSSSIVDAIKRTEPSDVCDNLGRIMDEGDPNCTSYYWNSEFRYRVIVSGATRIFSMSNPSRPYLIAMIHEDGAAQITRGAVRITSGFVLDLALGSVEAKPVHHLRNRGAQ
ncbi:hypothetical protein G6L37_34950 [Agrobacterium rubi]|nr:hypothetical protein [Agrobacterium rubi]NTF23768.1 hypothetical protein [Agrobacterium rubi]